MPFLNLTYEILHYGEAVCGGRIRTLRELLTLLRKYRRRKMLLRIHQVDGDGADY